MSKTHVFGPIVLALLFLNTTNARADLLTECNSWASLINKSTPQTLDNVTTLLNAICVQEGRAVQLVYRNRLSVQPGTVNQAALNTIRPRMVNTWCTDPTQRATLNQVDIRYHYADDSGKFIGKVDISKSDCR